MKRLNNFVSDYLHSGPWDEAGTSMITFEGKITFSSIKGFFTYIVNTCVFVFDHNELSTSDEDSK